MQFRTAHSRARDERTVPAFRIVQRDCEISLSMPFRRIVTVTIAIPFVCVWPTLASHLCCSSTHCVFPFSPFLSPSHVVSIISFFLSIFFLSVSLSFSLIALFASSRAELRGKRQGGGVGRGSRVDEGRRGRRQRKGELCVELIRAWLTGSRL